MATASDRARTPTTMLTWSASTHQNSIASTNQGSRAAEVFLDSWNAAVYECQPIKDGQLDDEAKLWRSKFAHLRLIGKPIGNCSKSVVRSAPQNKSASSKSASIIRDHRDCSLPRLEHPKKVVPISAVLSRRILEDPQIDPTWSLQNSRSYSLSILFDGIAHVIP
ncbi:unnamed protein product [Caenorhabditis bovis]|uniref:DUF3719 domain-containing protein n=1 Tax=Caenorhabditis bovis TaxID=2654633 RepID=A0A8S1F7G3_9PELO|nr:unnamed protein product [Caenorhabditis bovis]